MAEILSCPFCRELFSEDEGRCCPDCDLPLVPLHRLPLSQAGREEAALDGVEPPQDQRLPWNYVGRGRGWLVLLSGLGLLFFFLPWVSLERPDLITLSGADLASSNAPWLWGGAVGWFLIIPLVFSRRSVNQLVGIRIICSFFCILTAGEATLLLLRPPEEHGYFSTGLNYEWALYGSLLTSLLATALAARLGGSLADFRDLPIDSLSGAETPRKENVH